jgi:putative ABC transport system permease protein
MRTASLVSRNLLYYWRTNLAVIAGVAAAVAVLAGALLVGDSVRASLRDLVLSRLGRTEYVISSTGFRPAAAGRTAYRSTASTSASGSFMAWPARSCR